MPTPMPWDHDYRHQLDLHKVALWQALNMQGKKLTRRVFDPRLTQVFDGFRFSSIIAIRWEVNRLIRTDLQYRHSGEELQWLFDVVGTRNWILDEPDFERWRDDEFMREDEERYGTHCMNQYSDHYSTYSH